MHTAPPSPLPPKIQLLVRCLVADGRVHIIFLHFLDAGYKLHGARSPEQMSDHRFCGIDFKLRGMFPKRKPDCARLKQIIQMCRRSMCIDVWNLVRFYPRILHGVFHRTRCARTVLRRRCNMVGIRGTSVAGYLCINLRSTLLRML